MSKRVQEKDIGTTRGGVTGGWEPFCKCWESNSGPLGRAVWTLSGWAISSPDCNFIEVSRLWLRWLMNPLGKSIKGDFFLCFPQPFALSDLWLHGQSQLFLSECWRQASIALWETTMSHCFPRSPTLLIYFGRTGDWTQCLTYAKQILHPLSCIPNPKDDSLNFLFFFLIPFWLSFHCQRWHTRIFIF